MTRSVFVSHAVADKRLVESFVRLMEHGIGVPESEIFCVSIPGMGIPTGQSFVDYIKNEMVAPALVIMLITPNYLSSTFCQGEMGAAWIKGHSIYPLIVPPATFADMSGVFLGTQAIKIDDDIRINELRERLTSTIDFAPKSGARWDMARAEFYAGLPDIVAALPKPTTVSSQVHADLEHKYEQMIRELSAQNKENARLQDQISELKSLKDAEQVAHVARTYSDESAGGKLLERLKAVKSSLSSVGPKVLKTHVLAQHYGKPFEGWRDDQDVFDSAIRRNFLNDDLSVRESAPAIKKVIDELDALDRLVREEREALEDYASAHFDIPLETDNEDFWREHFL